MKNRIFLTTGLLAACVWMNNAWAACAEPQFGCVVDFEKAQLQIKPNGKWNLKLLKGTVNPGEHDASTSYDVCIYDGAGVYQDLSAEAGDNWSTPAPGKAKYKNSENELRKMRIKSSGEVSLGKINAKGRLAEAPTLPLSEEGTGVFVQVVRRVEGVFQECWEASFDGSDIKKNSEKKFQARVNNKGKK